MWLRGFVRLGLLFKKGLLRFSMDVRHRIMKVAKDCDRFPKAMLAFFLFPLGIHDGGSSSGMRKRM
jgi:hypothetical protein